MTGMNNLPQEQKAPRRSGTHPEIIAAGGALLCSGLGFGTLGVIAGGVAGLIVGILAKKEEAKNSD